MTLVKSHRIFSFSGNKEIDSSDMRASGLGTLSLAHRCQGLGNRRSTGLERSSKRLSPARFRLIMAPLRLQILLVSRLVS